MWSQPPLFTAHSSTSGHGVDRSVVVVVVVVVVVMYFSFVALLFVLLCVFVFLT